MKMTIARIVALFVIGSSAVAQDAVQWRVEDGGNGHWYEVVDAGGVIYWPDAKSAAENLGGHLGTVTSLEENLFISQFSLTGETWLGATDEPGESWHWITGEPWGYTAWNVYDCHDSHQPDNSGGDEDCLVPMCLTNEGWYTWSDVYGTNSNNSYLVEWSADCNDDGIVDYGQILDGTFVDVDANGIPDVCEDLLLDVPDEYATIQDALDASVAGDVILVQPGTYTGEGAVVFTLPLHLVTIVGAEDQEDAIIDGESVRRGMDFNSGGDTLNPTIRNLVFRNCDGRAITLNDSNLTLEDCDFVDNTAVGGAAISTSSSDVTLTNCFFRNNVAIDYGAILLNTSSSGNFTDCVFVENHSTGTTSGNGRGGVMLTSTSPTTFDRCVFVGNTGVDAGTGALDFRYQVSENHIANSIFCSNTPQDIAGTWINDDGNQFLESGQCPDFDADCNGNGILDIIDVVQGTAVDCNGNFVPDECELTEQFAFSVDRTPESFGDFIEFDLSSGSDTAEDVALQLSVVGELGATREFLYVYLDETLLGLAFATDGIDCEEVTQDFLITSAEWNTAGLDGTRLIRITGINIDPAACANPRTAIDVVLSIIPDDCDANGTWDECDPDSDQDGAIDACENCPDDPYKTEPGECGCGVAETGDSDGDGTPDCNDPCPSWPGDCSEDGQTIYVVAGESIQAAIDVCPGGGTVSIGPGTYTGTGDSVITLPGNGIGIIGSGGAASTIIDGENVRRGLLGVGCGDNGTAIEGLTFQNGYADNGGGISLNDCSPSLLDCTISDNSVSNNGGGMYLSNGSSPTITGCDFNDNSTSYSNATHGGGGMSIRDSNPELDACNFVGNTSEHDGGGLFFYSGTATVNNCTFVNNSANVTGGGLHVSSATMSMSNCTFDGNIAGNSDGAGDGGGIRFYAYTDATLTNCTFTNNHADSRGGALFLTIDAEGVVSLTNCEITLNTADGSGGGFAGGGWNGSGGEPALADTLVCGNAPDQNTDEWVDNGGNCISEICDSDGDGTLDCNDGCPNDPNKTDPGKCGCGVEDVDTDGDGTADCVDPCPEWPYDCSSRSDLIVAAGQSIQLAIDVITDGGTIQIVPGTFFENLDTQGKSLVIESTDPAGSTVIDGSQTGAAIASLSESGATIVLNGLTLQNGSGADIDGYLSGGALAVRGDVVIATDCTFMDSNAQYGGGVYLEIRSGLGAGTFIDCTFTNNVATERGGAISSSVPLDLAGCLIEQCFATQQGGGIFLGGSATAIIDYSAIRGNDASAGGGVYIGDTQSAESTADIRSSVICSNTVDQIAGSGTLIDDGNNCILDDCGDDLDENGVPDVCDPDCDGDGEPDAYEISSGQDTDCNENLIPDGCDITDGTAEDCNDNDLPDACDIADGTEDDDNDNGIPDACELAEGDLNLDGCINGADLAIMLGLWGIPNPPIGDLDGDGDVDGADLARILGGWRPCPG